MINYSGHFVANDAAELIFAAGRTLLFNSVAPSPRLTDPVEQLDPFSSQPKLAGKLSLHRKLATIDRCLKAASLKGIRAGLDGQRPSVAKLRIDDAGRDTSDTKSTILDIPTKPM